MRGKIKRKDEEVRRTKSREKNKRKKKIRKEKKKKSRKAHGNEIYHLCMAVCFLLEVRTHVFAKTPSEPS